MSRNIIFILMYHHHEPLDTVTHLILTSIICNIHLLPNGPLDDATFLNLLTQLLMPLLLICSFNAHQSQCSIQPMMATRGALLRG
jgi:hypothetical protein